MQIAKTSCCIETRNIVFWICGIMCIYLIIFTAIAVTDWYYAKYLPVMMIQECIPINNTWDEQKFEIQVQSILKEQSIIMLIYDAVICSIFTYLSYEMSDQRKEFSIRNELLIIITIWVFSDLVYLAAVLQILYGDEPITKDMLKQD